jgi:hypothetical protein
MSTFNGWTLYTLPSTPAPKSIEFEDMDVVGVSRSPFSLNRQVYNWQQGIMRWSVSYPSMTNTESRAWVAFLKSLQGVAGAFLIGDPLNTAPQNPSATAGTVTGSGQTGNVLVTSSSGLLPGDWFSLGVRLYMVTAVSGGTLTISPPLRESPAGGTSLVIADAQGLFCLAKNTRQYRLDVSKLWGITLEIEEAL